MENEEAIVRESCMRDKLGKDLLTTTNDAQQIIGGPARTIEKRSQCRYDASACQLATRATRTTCQTLISFSTVVQAPYQSKVRCT